MTLYIGLLRGINVGGNKKIKMADLKVLCEALGFRRVHTLLQSGNVVFEPDTDNTAEIVTRMEAAIVETFGFESRVIVRTLPQLEAAIQANPFTAEERSDPSHLLVMFLATEPAAEAAQALLESTSGPERLSLAPGTLYVYYGSSLATSKLTNVFLEKRLKTIGTARNWNTVLKLRALCESLGDA